MKKVLFLAAFLPAALIAQNITNTLGASGTFLVEDNGNNSLVRANRTGTVEQIYIGDYASGFSLPPYSGFSNSGNVVFAQNNATSRLDIISSGLSHSSLLQFLYTPGTLTSTLDLVNGNTLGTLNFGGYFGSWRPNAARITVSVDGAPSGIADIPTKITFTNNASSSTSKVMTYDSGGNLIVPASITSQAITSVAVNYAATANDQTIVCTTNITVTLPAVANVPAGKTYTIKKGYAANTATTINTTSSQLIDAATSTTITGNNTYSYITVQSDGTRWWIIAQGNGI